MPIKARTAISILIILGLMLPVFSYSQEAKERPKKYLRGRIRDTDFVGSKITVQWFYSTGKMADDEITFIIPDNARIFSDKSKIFEDPKPAGVTDLKVGEKVIVEYYDDKEKGYPEAIIIRILERDRPIPP